MSERIYNPRIHQMIWVEVDRDDINDGEDVWVYFNGQNTGKCTNIGVMKDGKILTLPIENSFFYGTVQNSLESVHMLKTGKGKLMQRICVSVQTFAHWRCQ